jgi:hypothetical protein
VELELDPPQPPEVVRAVAALLDAASRVDPWWQAGLDEAVAEAPLSSRAYGEATARPRRTRGAERA